jgi:hypothetical protein
MPITSARRFPARCVKNARINQLFLRFFPCRAKIRQSICALSINQWFLGCDAVGTVYRPFLFLIQKTRTAAFGRRRFLARVGRTAYRHAKTAAAAILRPFFRRFWRTLFSGVCVFGGGSKSAAQAGVDGFICRAGRLYIRSGNHAPCLIDFHAGWQGSAPGFYAGFRTPLLDDKRPKWSGLVQTRRRRIDEFLEVAVSGAFADAEYRGVDVFAPAFAAAMVLATAMPKSLCACISISRRKI